MRKSYIALSLILSQALCAGATDVIADFSDKNGGASSEGKLKPSSVTKPNGQQPPTEDAKYGTDWSGSESYLNIMTDGLTFTFSDTNSGTNLVIKNGFTFTNKIPNTDGSTDQKASVTIIKSNSNSGGSLTDFTFGSATSTSISDKITLGSNINLKITDFTSVKNITNLSIGVGSTLDTSTISGLTNDGGIVLEGKDSTLKVQGTLTNNGTVMMKEGSSITSGETNDLKVLSGGVNDRGSIIVQGDSTISTANSTLTITSQDIKIQNTVSKTDGKVNVNNPTLTLKSTKANGTLTLGDTSKVVNISGEIGNKDPSNIPSTDIPSGSEIGKVVVSGFTTLNLQNVNFKNINLTSENVNKLDLNAGSLGLTNTTMKLAGTSTIENSGTTSTITLNGDNAISVGESGTLTVTGTHIFAGTGTLDFVGDTIKLGNGSSAKFEVSGSNGDSPKIGVSAKSGITTNDFSLTNLTLQAISSTITNTSMTLSNAILEAIDSEENLSQLTINGSSNGTITISNGTTATLRGSGVSLTNQNITLANGTDQRTTLTLNAGSGGILLNNVKVTGANSLQNNVLNIQASTLTTEGSVTLENIALVSDRDLSIVGTAKGTSNGLFIKVNANAQPPASQDTFSTIFVGNKKGSTTNFHALTLASQKLAEDEQAYISIDSNGGTVDFRASSFTFQNQKISLATSGTGTKLRLFAYGSGEIEESFLTMQNGSSTVQLSGSGAFNFSNTTFTDGSTSTVELYAGSGGVNLLPTNLTLNGVSIDAKIIDNNGGNSYNSLNLSASNGSINILGTSTIQASKFIYGDSQGIGVDLTIGDDKQIGKLTLQSSTSSDNFIIGGNITLDIRANQSGSNVEIELKNGSSNKLSDNSLGLTFRGGGLTVIGSNAGSSSHTFKAKSFTFEEVKGTDNTVIDSPFVKVQNAQLTLNGVSSMNAIDFVGKVYLEGAITGSNGVSKLLATNNGTNSGTGITLTLHDIDAVGNSAIDSNKLKFSDSNITVSNSGDKGLVLKDMTDPAPSPDSLITGTIDSIALNNGKLEFHDKSSTTSSASYASITLNADSVITSSGASSLTLNTIKVGSDGTTGLYSLNVTDGTFTLTEKSAGNQLGAITLGSEDSSIGGAGASFDYKKNGGSNDLTLRGDLTSYGASSIIANSFTISAKDDSSNYAISSTGGTLTLQTQTASALELTADLTLSDGGLKYVDNSGQNAELKFGSKATITSVGVSSIEGKNLDINGANITASGGTLTLRGISSSTKAGSVVVGDSGVLRLEGSNSKLATLRVNDTIALSASVPYITPNEPLGGGVFGQVVAESVQFETQDKTPLITLSLSEASSTSAMSDSLFALREGGITLIDTNSGIKKKISSADYGNITLEDVSSDLGEFTSISLQPYLKYGKDTQGNQIVEDLMLDLKVTQTNVDQLVESIKDSSKKEQMSSLLSSGSNSLIIESIMSSNDNPLKTGMALYISSGNVDVVANALEYVTGAFIGLNDSLYASHKVAQGLKMIRATNVENRMVRGKNPYLAKLEVAQLVKRAIGVAYASSDDEILLEEESGVKDGELWASFDGAMGFSDLMGNASVYGFSGGYDTLLGEKKNYLLGFYFGYGYGSYSANFATNNSHNVSLGFYSRMSFENNEVDLILSQSIGLNTADIDYGATNSYAASMLKQSIHYNFYTTDVEARYGYVFSVGEKENPYYFRPFGGINFAMVVNSEGRGDGEAPIGVDSLITYQLSVSAGVEMRKYFGENYLYFLPVLEKGLLNDGNGTKIGFVGAQSIDYNLPYTVDTGVALYLGGQGNVGENIAVNGGVGVKMGFESKEVLTNWNLGIRYKF